MDWRTERGLIREEVVKYGLHDRIMSYPVVSLAILRAFQGVGSTSGLK
jgi:abhydrolase domain-containing protein 12